MFGSNNLYKDEIKKTASSNIDWDKIKNRTILITGATGAIGTFLVDLLMYRNIAYNDNIIIYALSRNRENAITRFKEYLDSDFFIFYQHDIQKPFELDVPVDYIIHGAGNAHPSAFAAEPIKTILTSIEGTKSILDFASLHNTQKTLFISTGEVYGENQSTRKNFKEDDCGYIDCNTLRAGYPEGKRTAEALCQAYIAEKNMNVVIARCCRIFSPTMTDNDSRATAQLIKNAVNGENIILKSNGKQQYSFCYIPDACSALMIILLNGKKGEAYNVSAANSNLSLFDISGILSEYAGTEVIFDIPPSTETSAYSKVTTALLDNSKLQELGWHPMYSIKEGLIKTIDILRQQKPIMTKLNNPS